MGTNGIELRVNENKTKTQKVRDSHLMPLNY